MTRSIHDNFVLGYEVDAERRSIIVHTEHRYGEEPFERTDVHFDDVLGYLFLDSLGGILFDIVEASIDSIVEAHAANFEWGTRYGWPWIPSGDMDPATFVASHDATTFRVESSIGFEGFVVAKSMRLEPVEPRG